jgi:5-methylcytosine-specific restriction protein B
MNAADRSIAPLDQALRRRFSFLEMPPDAELLRTWLDAHPPVDPALSERVLILFERLNARLRADLGRHAQVGHSYFMVSGLSEARLRMIWQHHIWPLLEEHFALQPARLSAYDIDLLLGARSKRKKIEMHG